MCSALLGLLRCRFRHLLENSVQVSSGVSHKQKESQDLILPISSLTMVDYAMLACFYQHYVYDDKTNNGNYLTRMFTTKSVVK